MLYGDKNRCILLSNNYAIVSRNNSIIKYSTQDFQREIYPVSFSLPRCFNDRIYDYSENKITSFQNNDFKDSSTKEFHAGNIKDYYKVGKDFYFVKSNSNSNLTLFSKESLSNPSKSLLDFRSLYYFDNSFIFAVEDGMLIRMNLRTLDKKIIREFTADPLMLCCQFSSESEAANDESEICESTISNYFDDMVAYTDSHNKLHIHHGKSYRLYHWLSNKAEHLSVYEDYIIAASRSGDVVKFHTKIQKIEPLFRFDGEFVDMKTGHNKIYLLTDSQFIVFDLESESLVYKEVLVAPADYRVCSVQAEPFEENSKDIFNLKKQSRMEVFNSLDFYNHYSKKKIPQEEGRREHGARKPVIAYAHHRHIYLFDPIKKMLVSQFLLDSDLNFVSNGKVITFAYRRTSMIVRVFSVFQDRLVLSSNMNVSSKSKIKITNAYYAQDKVFIEASNNLCYINKLNMIEILSKSDSPLNIKQEQNELFIIDEKGIFNVVKREYALKQKKTTNFCIFKGLMVFFIEDRGLYIDLPERRQALEIKNIIDITSEADSGGEVLKVLHLADGKYLIEDYDFCHGGESTCLEKRAERAVENSCFRMLYNNTCATKSNQLIII